MNIFGAMPMYWGFTCELDFELTAFKIGMEENE
jgi:hypothetical protein